MTYYVKGIDQEISGLGLVEKIDPDILYVPDIYLFEQSVSGVETKLVGSEVNKFYDEKMQDREFPLQNIKLWWHSHNDMSVFWSQQDLDTIENLDTEQDKDNWWLSIVQNNKGERKARMDQWKPHRLFMDNLTVEVGMNKELKDVCEAEIKEKVSVKKTTPVGYNYSYQNYHNYPTNKKTTQQKKDYKKNNKGIYVPEDEKQRDHTLPSSEKQLKAGKNKSL